MIVTIFVPKFIFLTKYWQLEVNNTICSNAILKTPSEFVLDSQIIEIPLTHTGTITYMERTQNLRQLPYRDKFQHCYINGIYH